MEETKKFTKKYEWVGDVDSYSEPTPNTNSEKYNEPDRDYDSEYKPTKDDIKSFPDLQEMIMKEIIINLILIMF